MSWTPNTIPLICRGRYDEAPAGADVYPGMTVLDQSAGTVLPNSLVNGGGTLPLVVVQEDALQGGDITQKIASGSIAPLRRAARGDKLLMLLKNGENVANGAPLVSAGDGTLVAGAPLAGQAATFPLYEILAPSSNITNVTAETAFSNGSYAIPANYLVAGDQIRITGKAVVSAENSTNTHNVKVYIGTGPTTLATCGAAALAAGEFAYFDITMTIRSLGSSGKFVADVVTTVNPSATPVETPATIAATTIDTTAIQTIVVKSTASAQSTGNVIALQEFTITLARESILPLVIAAEAINNSGGAGSSPISNFGSAAFIRVLVP